MSLASLLNRPITIVHRTTSGDTDAFGNDVPTETLISTTGELQQRQRKEAEDEGELSDAQWTLFLLPGTDIATGDAIVCDGQIYELVGDPWDARNPRTQIFSHIECTLRRVASSNDELLS